MEAAVQEFGRDEFRPDAWDRLAGVTRYVTTDFADEHGQDLVARTLTELDEQQGTRGNRVYYLAVPPAAMPTLVQELGERRTTTGWVRLILEKPFGRDLASARELNEPLPATSPRTSPPHRPLPRQGDGAEPAGAALRERDLRADLELAVHRPRPDHRRVDRDRRAATYYDQAGAIRDIVQNHLLQPALTAMEPPIDFDAESVRNEKVKVLRALRTPNPRAVIRGQYGRGFIEESMCRATERSRASRRTRTRRRSSPPACSWTTGAGPTRRSSSARASGLAARDDDRDSVKRAPHPPFEDMHALRPNVLFVHVQPNEGVSLAIGAKVPGEGMRVRTVHMDFLYGGTFRTGLPEAYERLILDTMLGDPTLFTRGRDRGAVGARRRDRGNLDARAAELPQLRSRNVGAGRGSGARGMASVAIEAWADDCATIEEIEDALADLRLRVGHRGVPTSGRVSSPTWLGPAGG